MIESHEEDKEEDNHNDTNESCEHSWGIYSLCRCFSHNDRGSDIMQLIGVGLFQRVSKIDFAVGDGPPNLLLESIIAYY